MITKKKRRTSLVPLNKEQHNVLQSRGQQASRRRSPLFSRDTPTCSCCRRCSSAHWCAVVRSECPGGRGPRLPRVFCSRAALTPSRDPIHRIPNPQSPGAAPTCRQTADRRDRRAMLLFHRRCGERVSLANGHCTAVRNVSEYNFGLVFSAEPLRDDEVFQVRIDKKVSFPTQTPTTLEVLLLLPKLLLPFFLPAVAYPVDVGQDVLWA